MADAVEAMRVSGVGAWYTMDAGPHVKILCAAGDETKIIENLSQVVPAEDLILVRPGQGARLIDSC